MLHNPKMLRTRHGEVRQYLQPAFDTFIARLHAAAGDWGRGVSHPFDAGRGVTYDLERGDTPQTILARLNAIRSAAKAVYELDLMDLNEALGEDNGTDGPLGRIKTRMQTNRRTRKEVIDPDTGKIGVWEEIVPDYDMYALYIREYRRSGAAVALQYGEPVSSRIAAKQAQRPI